MINQKDIFKGALELETLIYFLKQIFFFYCLSNIFILPSFYRETILSFYLMWTYNNNDS